MQYIQTQICINAKITIKHARSRIKVKLTRKGKVKYFNATTVQTFFNTLTQGGSVVVLTKFS